MVIARTQTLVQLTDDLIQLLDARAARERVSRSYLIRQAVEAFLRDEREADIDRRMVEGYARHPQDGDIDDWGDLGAWLEAAGRETFRALEKEERAAGEPW